MQYNFAAAGVAGDPAGRGGARFVVGVRTRCIGRALWEPLTQIVSASPCFAPVKHV
jgi:hypothetical protein